MRASVRSLFAVLLVLLVPAAACSQSEGAAAAQERFVSFVSDVTIEPDGEIDVTETMKIDVRNQQIKHGIYRDFPTQYIDGSGRPTSVGFEVVSVTRDGRDEPWSRESISGGVRVRIGSPDVVVTPGDHTYALRYRATRMVSYGKDYDELYWNVTGNGWVFPIEMAEARVRLPAKTAFTDKNVWTGPQGSTDQNAKVVTDRPGFIVFRTTAPLDSYEGMTISVKFPKGVLRQPEDGQELRLTRNRFKTDANS